MEINITKFYNEACPKEDAEFFQFLDTPEKVDAFKAFVLDSGGWSKEEINAWSVRELNALFLQWIAGDIRECLEWDVDDVWANYQEMAQAGTVPSRLFKTDDGQVYFDLS